MNKSDDHHFSQKPRRKAEFFNPPNLIKQKVGSGGLNEEILNKAQAMLENNTVDFRPLGEMYLDALTKGVELARTPPKGMETENIDRRHALSRDPAQSEWWHVSLSIDHQHRR